MMSGQRTETQATEEQWPDGIDGVSKYAATYQVFFTDGSRVVGHALPGEVSPHHAMEQGRPFFLYQEEVHWGGVMNANPHESDVPTMVMSQRRLIINPNTVCYLKEMT